MKKKILIVDDNQMVLGLLNHKLKDDYDLRLAPTLKIARLLIKNDDVPDLVIVDLNLGEEHGLTLIKYLKKNPKYSDIAILVLSGDEKSETRIECLSAGADDYVGKPFHPEELKLRIDKLLNSKEDAKALEEIENLEDFTFPEPKMSFRKRAFDVVLSLTAILILLPVFITVGVLIKLDSKGPFLYLSKRVGAGYKIFNLYKFRTMKVNADKEISKMDDFNMYKKDELEVSENDKQELIYDGGWMSEQALQTKKESKAAFMKFQNDPRITRLGTFLRNSSLDELPQLFNILKGDMSIVGNRPLPPYEAEKLTKDESAARFLAPAGLTGLWQVTKRGQVALSEKERMDLDNTYAQEHNWLYDIKLILKTFPAVFQSEKM